MKIVHVYKDYFPPVYGGIERHVAAMCRIQSETDDVEALVCSRAFRTHVSKRDAVRVTAVGEWGRVLGAPVSPAFPFYYNRLAPDVAVVQVPNPTAELGWLLARPRCKLVVRYQSDVVRQARTMRLYRPFFERFLSRADRILVSSPQYLETSPHLQAFHDRCAVVPLGVDVEAFASIDESETEAVRSRYGGAYVLFSGRHRYYKGLEYLVDAARDLAAPVVIAGDGPERERLMQRAKSQPSVYFPGPLSDAELRAHLHGAAVFAFPSVARSEAFGLSVLEAHACGTPVVATRLGTGVEYVNVDGETGFNVAPRDAAALSNAINRLLRDPALAQRFGDAARTRARREFDVHAVARRELAIYREVLECSQTGS